MNKNHIKAVTAFLCGGVLVLCGILSYVNLRSLVEAKNSWRTKSEESDKLKQEIAEIRQAVEFYKKEKKEFEGYLFAEKDVPAFLDGIAEYAQKASVHVLQMKTTRFQEVQVPVEFRESQSTLVNRRETKSNQPQLNRSELNQVLTLAAMPVNFKVTGQYQALTDFFSYLEGFRQLVNVSNVEISSTREYPELQCMFTIKIYSLKTLEELSAK